MFSFSKNRKLGSRRPRPKLERRNAVKNIDYDAVASASSSFSSLSSPPAPELLRATRSLDLSPSCPNQTSFRIGGSIEGEVDLICRCLGLSGPEDFAIPAAAWEASRAHRSSSDLLPRSRLNPTSHDPTPSTSPTVQDPTPSVEIRVSEDEPIKKIGGGGDGGIKGVRPPSLTPPATISTLSPSPTMSRSSANPSPSSVLAPPPSISLPVLEKVGSTWDLVMSFAPNDEEEEGRRRRSFDSEEEEEEDGGIRGGGNEEGEETSEDVTSTSKVMFVVSENGRFKRNIKSWIRGERLGSGSYGTVYEGISHDGTFFAVKEVSLLDKGSNAQQSILQLEQEIALLSQFEHENIVQYYGTDKEEAKLFIFLELVTQGSLASLYQKYSLRDTQISAYTRQILKGLKYLHERKVVHRDIKCANILVHANGSVKLADFGLAKEIKDLKALNSCKGSVYWMAPEVVNPKKTYGPAADIWSLGCTVLEMLTRQIPYPNLEWQHAFYMIGRGVQPSIPNYLSKDACDFISQCVQVNPDDRPSASKLLEHPFVNRLLPSSSSGSDYSSSPSNDRWN